MKIEYILSFTAVITLILNLLLTAYLLKDKLYGEPVESKNGDILNFVLTPVNKAESAAETEILATEIILDGDN